MLSASAERISAQQEMELVFKMFYKYFCIIIHDFFHLMITNQFQK